MMRPHQPAGLCANAAATIVALILGGSAAMASAETDCPPSRSIEDRFMRADMALRKAAEQEGRDRDEVDLAIRHLTCAFNTSIAEMDSVGAAAAGLALGDIYERRGRYQAALQHYERGLDTLDGGELGDELFVGQLLSEIRGSEKRVPTKLGGAGGLDVYRGEVEALDLLIGEPDEIAAPQIAVALAINAGNLYLEQHQFEQADLYYRQALQFANEVGDRLLAARTTANLAWVSIRQDDNTTAERLLRQTLDDLPVEYRVELRRALLAVAVNLREQGQLEAAIGQLHEAIGLYRSADDERGLAVTLAHLGTAFYQAGQLPNAKAAYSSALNLSDDLDDPRLELHANGGMARVAHALGDPETAERHYDRYFDALGDITSSWNTDQGRVGIFENQRAIFDEYVSVATEAAANGGDFGIVRKAAERGRARVLPSLIRSRSRAPLRPAGEVAAIPFLYGERFGDAQVALGLSFPPTFAASPNQAVNTPVQMPLSVDELGEPVFDDAAREALGVPMRDIEELDTRAAQARLPTLLEYYSTENRLIITVRRPDGEIQGAIVDMGSPELSQLVNALLRSLDVEKPRGVGLVAAAAMSGTEDAVRGNPDKISRQLHSLLIRPVAANLPANPSDDLVIIPHGSLWRLPFAALVDQEGTYLQERHALSYVNSEETWRLLAAKQRRESSRRNAWIMGNPEMPGDLTRCEVDVSLTQLPGAEIEAREIGELFGNGSSEVFLGGQADKLRLTAWHSQYDVLHFATHGLACPNEPLSSFLALTTLTATDVTLDRDARLVAVSRDPRHPVSLAGWDHLADIEELRDYENPSFDGLLEAWTVINEFQLSADLVTLSACQTGLGQLSGEGMIGFTRAFLASGARSVLVSLWKVDDDATKTLMLHFYKAYLAHGNKGLALHTAMAKTRSEYPDPRHWAAFTLVGLSE